MSYQTHTVPERCRFGPDRDVDRGRNVRSASKNTPLSPQNACKPRVRNTPCASTHATRRSCPFMGSIWPAVNLYLSYIDDGLILSTLVPRRMPKSAEIGPCEAGENGLPEPGALSGRLRHIENSRFLGIYRQKTILICNRVNLMVMW